VLDLGGGVQFSECPSRPRAGRAPRLPSVREPGAARPGVGIRVGGANREPEWRSSERGSRRLQGGTPTLVEPSCAPRARQPAPDRRQSGPAGTESPEPRGAGVLSCSAPHSRTASVKRDRSSPSSGAVTTGGSGTQPTRIKKILKRGKIRVETALRGEYPPVVGLRTRRRVRGGHHGDEDVGRTGNQSLLRGALRLVVGLLSLLPVRASHPDVASALRIAVTRDLRGWLEPCDCKEGVLGGFPRRATILAELKPDLLLDAGDLVSQASPYDPLKLRFMLALDGRLGYAAANPGRLEAEFGQNDIHETAPQYSTPPASLESAEGAAKAVLQGLTIERRKGWRSALVWPIRPAEHNGAIFRAVQLPRSPSRELPSACGQTHPMAHTGILFAGAFAEALAVMQTARPGFSGILRRCLVGQEEPGKAPSSPSLRHVCSRRLGSVVFEGAAQWIRTVPIGPQSVSAMPAGAAAQINVTQPAATLLSNTGMTRDRAARPERRLDTRSFRVTTSAVSRRDRGNLRAIHGLTTCLQRGRGRSNSASTAPMVHNRTEKATEHLASVRRDTLGSEVLFRGGHDEGLDLLTDGCVVRVL
jgi:hypothetical protein